MRKGTTAIAASVLLAVSAPAAAEMTLDQVIAKHVEARGGRDAWSRIENIRASGTFTAFSKVAPFTLHKTNDRRYHLDHTQNDRTVVIGYDGNKAWWDNHWFQEGAQPLEGPDLAAISRDFDFINPLFDYEERGYELELVGPSEYEGIPAIEIKVDRGDGSSETWFLDPDSYLELARLSPGSDFGRPMEQRTMFDDFREVDGVMIPHYTETQWYTRDRVMRIEKIETNVSIDAALFREPAPPGMGALLPMAGEWKVSVEQRQQPGAPFQASESTAKIEKLLRGALLRATEQTARGNTLLWDLAWDQHREVYRLTSINNRQTYIDVLEGTPGEDGTIALDNTRSQTTLESFGMSILSRMKFLDISDDGFRVEIEVSMDGGENWMLMGKQAYAPAPAGDDVADAGAD